MWTAKILKLIKSLTESPTEQPIAHREAYEEGFRARTEAVNPYAEGSPEHASWMIGREHRDEVEWQTW